MSNSNGLLIKLDDGLLLRLNHETATRRTRVNGRATPRTTVVRDLLRFALDHFAQERGEDVPVIEPADIPKPEPIRKSRPVASRPPAESAPVATATPATTPPRAPFYAPHPVTAPAPYAPHPATATTPYAPHPATAPALYAPRPATGTGQAPGPVYGTEGYDAEADLDSTKLNGPVLEPSPEPLAIVVCRLPGTMRKVGVRS